MNGFNGLWRGFAMSVNLVDFFCAGKDVNLNTHMSQKNIQSHKPKPPIVFNPSRQDPHGLQALASIILCLLWSTNLNFDEARKRDHGCVIDFQLLP